MAFICFHQLTVTHLILWQVGGSREVHVMILVIDTDRRCLKDWCRSLQLPNCLSRKEDKYLGITINI